MSHHRHDAENQEVQENVRERRHSHNGHLHLKPTAVIDHLKRKVKQRRAEKLDSLALSDSASSRITNTNLNEDNNRRSSPKQGQLKGETSSTTNDLISSNNKSSHNHDINNNDHNIISIEKNEQNSVVSNQIKENENVEETVQWRTKPPASDADQQMCKLKLKLVKSTKSLPETNSQLGTKKRRQAVRRTAFQIRDEDFSVIFSNLPSDEQLVIAFPCAWRKDVFIHGRMFLSVNYFCFYTCFFKWEESLCIPYTDIISITREKSAKLVPNAIKIRLKNQEQYVFASLVSREKVYLAVFRLWQNTLLEQPMQYELLRAFVYADQQNHDESTGDSDDSRSLVNTGEAASESGIQSKSLPPLQEPSTGSAKRSKKSNRRVVSSPPVVENESPKYLPTCTCETHLAKTYADEIFTFNVDTLFELICGDNSFTQGFHDSQKLTDFTYSEWQVNEETGKRERELNYKTISQSILGTNTLICREEQVLDVEKPGSIYILNTQVYNGGMKYTDAFYVATRFCMVQRDSEHSSLRVTAEINYVKNVNGIIKTFIEKNSNAYIENGENEQIRRLRNHQQVTSVKHKSNSKSVAKHNHRKSIDNKKPENPMKHGSTENRVVSNSSLNEKTITGKGPIYDIGLFIGIALLLLHIYLCYKFYSIDHVLPTSVVTKLDQCRKACLDNNLY